MVKYSKGNLLKFSISLKKIKVNRKTIGLIEQDQLAMLRDDPGSHISSHSDLGSTSWALSVACYLRKWSLATTWL